jgi:secreted PhoX family phosphatase
MSDGHPTPRDHDGMATFNVKGQLRLVRNHELNDHVGRPGAALGNRVYDPLAGGGTTTLVIDAKSREIVKDFLSLSGTSVNCAGGPTPWNSWISCEEITYSSRTYKDENGGQFGGFTQRHGYCFEVPAAAEGLVPPVPLKAMGRFYHEALAVDPATGIVYMTEDRQSCGFYRFLPNKRGHLIAGGRLQMLAIKGQPKYDTRTGQKERTVFPVTWVDIKDPDPAEADVDELAVYKEGLEAGGATFRRLEGCWFGRGKVFFNSTSGGETKLGQVWEYTPTSEGGELTLILQPTDASVMNMPDNLCISRNGNLVICEDNGSSVHLQLLTRQGQVASVAKNVLAGFETREFAGVCFSPDGQTLFLNIQVPGITLAIWGPWDRV